MHRLFLCAALALLSGCATPPKPAITAPGGTTENMANSWPATRTGRISVRAPDARGIVQSWHAGFEFTDSERLQTLSLTDPLGTTLARIEADASGARMTTAQGDQTAYGSLAELTQRVTGVALPDTAWRHWLKGTPAPNLPVQAQGRLGFGQSGFWINVVSRFENSNPRVLEITRPDTPELQVRIALEAAP
jgi:outer membrane lipoprotein LolB